MLDPNKLYVLGRPTGKGGMEYLYYCGAGEKYRTFVPDLQSCIKRSGADNIFTHANYKEAREGLQIMELRAVAVDA